MSLAVAFTNVRRLKGVIWVAGLVATGFAGVKFVDMYETYQAGGYSEKPRTYFDQIISAARTEVGDVQAQDRLKDGNYYKKVWESPINGYVPKKAEPPKPEDEIAEKKFSLKPIDEALVVTSIVHDPGGKGVATVQYLDDIKAVSMNEVILRAGSSLKYPFNEEPFLGSVKEIRPDAVVFAWGGGEEVISTRKSQGTESGTASTGEERSATLSDREQELLARHQDSESSIRLDELGPENYLVGTADRRLVQEEYENLHNLVRLGEQTGPKGRELVIQHARPSLQKTYGVRDGDVLISINGVPVKSKNEAINYVRQNPDLPRYDVVLSRLGKEIQKTFYVPDDGP